MNSLMALYFWLMITLGVPGFGPGTDAGVASHSTHAVGAITAPPPEEPGWVAERHEHNGFISNGF